MCYAIPAKIIKLKNKVAVVDYFGEHRQVLLDLDDVKVGDYVYAQGGIMVSKIAEREALEILDVWRDLFFELKETDAELSEINQKNLSENALAILQKINLKKTIDKKEMMSLLELSDPKEQAVLYEVANNIRQQVHGNATCVHGIIEFSNYCQGSCHYCGIRKERNIKRYRLVEDEIIAIAKDAVERFDFKAIVLQSGEDYWYTDEKLERIVKEVRALGVLVFLSIGDRTLTTYQKLYEAGARAVLMRFETTNEKIFTKIRPGTTLEERLNLIRGLKSMGYILATGFLLGLPGETTEDIANNILMTKSLKADMYSFGPLIPAHDTPLANHEKVAKELVLKTTAISRLVDNDTSILVTTALETLDIHARREALLAGAGSMMINLTPVQYRSLYSIYDNRSGNKLAVEQGVEDCVKLLYDLGRAPTDIGLNFFEKD